MRKSKELSPCPFCGGSDTVVDVKTYWTGRSSQLLSATVLHWCNKGNVDGAILKISGKTEEEAIKRWNYRANVEEKKAK